MLSWAALPLFPFWNNPPFHDVWLNVFHCKWGGGGGGGRPIKWKLQFWLHAFFKAQPVPVPDRHQNQELKKNIENENVWIPSVTF